MIVSYFTDLIIATIVVVGLTAVMGVVTNDLFKYVFARGKRTEFVDKTARMQIGWNHVGGNRKK